MLAESQPHQTSLALSTKAPATDRRIALLLKELEAFDAFGPTTVIQPFNVGGLEIPQFINEFWTAKQRAGHSIHEISYRACFKPQLPAFFIDRLTEPGDLVYDPFTGRGTTLIEAALNGRRTAGCDANPLAKVLIPPRLRPPSLEAVAGRLNSIPLDGPAHEPPEDFDVFYHPKTLQDICHLRAYLDSRRRQGVADTVDEWIAMVATNRLTGHSPGFFSVYTMPPNQAVSMKAQKRINERRKQTPPERDIKAIILKKSKSLLRDPWPEPVMASPPAAGNGGRRPKTAQVDQLVVTHSADAVPEIPDQSVRLVVTSPPFLDVVDYHTDNWLRCWFNGLDSQQAPVWQIASPPQWQQRMKRAFLELHRVLEPGGVVAFEVGDIKHKGELLNLETLAAPAGLAAGLVPEFILINDQEFTKTANCWGVTNRQKGTNTNRVICFRKF